MFFSAVSPGSSLVLDPTGRMAGLGGKTGSACEEFEDSEGGILSTSSDAGSPGSLVGCSG